MNGDTPPKGCIYLLFFVLFGSGLVLLATSIAGLVLPRFTQFCVGVAILLFATYIAPEFERKM